MKAKPLSNNIIGICSDCSDQRRKDFHEENPECNLTPEDYVKVAVQDDGETEHMWFKVLFVDGDKIVGQLDNYPIVVTNISYGDNFGFAYENVEQIIKPEEDDHEKI